jgi:soluble lytic murein transglycosylase-like protein
MRKLILALAITLSTAVLCYAPDRMFGNIADITTAACAAYGVDKTHIDALFFEETGINNIRTRETRIKKYAYGPGQILYNTAKDVGYTGPECGLNDAHISIPFTVKFVAKLFKRYHGDWSKICSHYKTGRSRYGKYGKAHNAIYQEFVKADCI